MYIQVRRIYKYRMYQSSKHEKKLNRLINIAALIWNHCIALQRKYYRLFGGYIKASRLMRHIAKLRMKTKRYSHWKILDAQAVQNIVQRLDSAYQKFFQKKGGLPHFRKVTKYKSFTLKKNGWKLIESDKKYGKIQIGKVVFKFVKHREINGIIRTVTIKRDTIGRFWLCFSVLEGIQIPEPSTGEIGGFDFGLRTFLTDHTGKTWMSPEFYKQMLKRIKTLSRAVSRKINGSHNQQKARWLLSRTQIRIADKRCDFCYKLAHELCKEYAILAFEDLNLEGMKKLWGRKVSDLGFGQFVEILEDVAFEQGKLVIFLDRFEPTSQICSNCGHKQKMKLGVDRFLCPSCGLDLDRDHNAAINIRARALAHTTRGDIRPE